MGAEVRRILRAIKNIKIILWRDIDEITELKGVPVDKIRVKKDE